MSPLFLVNWHRVHRHFRTLMWLVAIALALMIVLGTSRGSSAAGSETSHGANPHVVADTIHPSQ
jgi:hypothetical protein